MIKFQPIQIGSPKECERFLAKLVKDKTVSNAAFKLVYFVIYELHCYPFDSIKIANIFDWPGNLTVDVVKEVERLGVVKIL